MNKVMDKKRAISFVAKYGSTILMIASFLYFSIRMPSIWLTSYMLSTVIEQTVSLGFVALGLTVVMTCGETDMSIGSIVSLASMLSMMSIANNQPIWLAMLIALICGMTVGVLNGFMRTTMKIPGIIPTIGTQSAIAGVALMVNSGNMIYGSGDYLKSYTYIGRGYKGVFPISAIIFVVVAIFLWFVLSRTKTGRLFTVIGGNPKASMYSGVLINRQVMKAYIISAALGAVAGIMASARSGSGNPEAGADLFLDGLIAVTLGSTILTDERKYGAMRSTVGALFITMMINGLQLMGKGYHVQCIMRGMLLLISLTISSLKSIAVDQ